MPGSITVQHYDRAEFDTPPDIASVRSLTYVVCSSQRSGSGLLCRGLGESGVAGRPTEYFNPELRALLSVRWGCGSQLPAYAAALRARRTSVDGVLGTKLHWYQFEALRDEAGVSEGGGAWLIEQLLGARPAYVHITRRDADRQAVSLWTAMHTGVWASASRAGHASVPYDFDGILECRRRGVLEEEGWRQFFRTHGIEPIEVRYEELGRSYAATIAAVLERLGVPIAARIAEPLTVRLADSRSEELLERFRADLAREASPAASSPAGSAPAAIR